MDKQKELEQYFLNKQGQIKLDNFISVLNLESSSILELGSGTGKMSKVLLDKNPNNLVLFELDMDLHNPISEHPSVITYNENILDINYNKYKNHLIVSAPPYQCVRFISEQIKKEKMDYILLISEKYLDLFVDYIELGYLESTDFTPNSKANKKHYVITNLSF